MANFLDLPKAIREKIYRLHLVKEESVTITDYRSICGDHTQPVSYGRSDYRDARRMMPEIFHTSRKIEREASRIYFGENTFALYGPEELRVWKHYTWPRHFQHVSKVDLLKWCKLENPAEANKAFMQLGMLPNLKSLLVQFDEAYELRQLLLFDPIFRCAGRSAMGPQMSMQLLRLPGMQGFRSIRGIQELKYMPSDFYEGQCFDGAIPGGLMNSIKREILGQMTAASVPKYTQRPFRFLELPPEIRNIIYKMLLLFPGATYPIDTKSVSITSQYKYKKKDSRAALSGPGSALDLLLVSRQIHDEAYAFFYQNDLIFSTPARLQIFMVSLSDNRLKCLKSLTFFNEYGRLVEGNRPYITSKMRNENSLERTNKMDVAVLLIRRLPNLQKLHFLYRSSTMSRVGGYETKRCNAERSLCPSDVKFLFQVRNLPDIKIRDLDVELDEALNYGGYHGVWADRERQKAAIRHLNHGLRLTQKSIVVRELFAGEDWRGHESWPVLQNSDCGSSTGCACGPDED